MPSRPEVLLPPAQNGFILLLVAYRSPQGLYGSARANALAMVDRRYDSKTLVVADLSNDATYAEPLFERFGPRLIGIQITRGGGDMNPERRQVKNGAILVYNIGRTYLLDLFLREMQDNKV